MNLTVDLYPNVSINICTLIQPDTKYGVVSSFLLVISTISSIFNFSLFLIFYRSSAFHANVRLLLENFALASTGLALHALVKSIYALLIFEYGFGHLSLSLISCQISEIVQFTCSISMTLSLGFLGVERLWMNLNNNFADQDRPTRFAYFLVSLCWVIGLIIFGIISTVIYNLSPFDQLDSICFCHSAFIKPLFIFYLELSFFIFLYIFMTIIYLYLYRRSARMLLKFSAQRIGRRRLSRVHSSLTERYHLAKNVRLCRLVYPTLVTHFCFGLLTSIWSVLVRQSNIFYEINYVFYVLAILNFMAFNTLCHPILIILRDARLKRLTLIVYPFLHRCIQEHEVISEKHSVEEVINVVGNERYQRRRSCPIDTIELVDYRMNPEQHKNILNAMWDQTQRN